MTVRDTPSTKDLSQSAEAIIGDDEPILAAGIFGLEDSKAAVAVASAPGTAVGEVIFDSALAAGFDAAATGHTSRELVAGSDGVTVRMLVTVTARRIHVLDWISGSGPTRELMSFDRATTEVQISKLGLSRHLNLSDSATGASLALTGSTAFFSVVAKGDKSVLRLLTEHR